MNNINSQKTLDKAIAFGFVLGAIVLFAMPTNKANAQYYPTNSGNYSTGNGYMSSTSTGGGGGMSGSFGNNGIIFSGSNGNNSNGSGSNGGSNGGQVVIGVDSKPVVSTEPATDIKTTSALIAGAAHVDSGTATVWFEWGTRVDKLDHSTRSVYVDNMSTGDSEMLTNLTPGTKYYFRVVAHNSFGTCYGTVLSFVTKGSTVTTTTSTGANSGTKTTIVKKAGASSTVSDDSIKGSLSASAANASGSGFMPSSILGWLIIIALVFIIAVVVRAIQREAEERKRRRDEEEARKKLAAA